MKILTYDILSNLTGISSPFFSQTAWYGHSPDPEAPVRYSGINALKTEWTDGQDLSGRYGHTETFAYDGLGRYRSSRTADGRISEQIGVDLDANVVSIVRKYNGDVVQDAEIVLNGGMITDVFDASTPYWMAEVGRFPEGSYAHTYDRDGRLTADGTRDITSVTYHPFGNLPRRITMGNGDYAQSDYFPDGTLRRRTFSSRKVETVVTVNAAGDTITRTRTRTQTAVRTYSGAFERTPDGLIYHTGAGYYDLSDKKHYSYLRDRMGSTAAVVDDDGRLVQTTGYYPSGTPYRLPSTAIGTPVDGQTDRLHIGNKWLGHSGLAMYDNTARLHDPLLMRYAAPDPLYAKFGSLSPWSHCASDPLNHFDPDGMETKLYFTKLPGAPKILDFATHSFITVEDDKGKDIYAFGSEYDGVFGAFTGKLERRLYQQDKAVSNGEMTDKIKGVFVIPPPEGMSSEEFDARVRGEAEAFAKDTKQKYFLIPTSIFEGNCNTSTSTILLRAGVSKDLIDNISKMFRFAVGFSSKDRAITKEKENEETERETKFQILIRLFE